MIRFCTDGRMVYELLAVQITRNAGLMAGNIRSYVLQPISDPDCTGPIVVNEKTFDSMIPVKPTVEHDVRDLQRDLDRWAEEEPVWLRRLESE